MCFFGFNIEKRDPNEFCGGNKMMCLGEYGESLSWDPTNAPHSRWEMHVSYHLFSLNIVWYQ